MEGETNDKTQIVPISYSALSETIGESRGEVMWQGTTGTGRKRFFTSTYLTVIYVFTSLVFAAFFVACLVLLARNQAPEATDEKYFNDTFSRNLEILRNEVEEMISSSQSLQEATGKKYLNDTLSRKLEILRTEVEDMISSSQSVQSESWTKVSDTIMKNSDTLRGGINKLMWILQSVLPEDLKSPMYLASNQRVYVLHKEKKNYAEAKSACRAKKARLASDGVRDSVVVRELLEFAQNHSLSNLCWGNQCFWIGLEYSDEANDWEWSDGMSNSSTINWAPREPNLSSEKCAVLYIGQKRIHNYPCNSKFYYLCEGLRPEEKN